MLTNDKVSILRYDKSSDDYVLAVTCDAWVFRKNGISGSTKGDENADVVHIRVRKEAVDGTVKVGDFVYVGAYDGKSPDLAECHKVTKVSNNKFGTVPHWHIEVGA